MTPLSYQKRIQGNLKCASCRKDEREAVKEKLREEERLQDAYYTEMQEKMFAEARREMEKEIADAGLGGGFNGSFGQSTFFMDEAQRRNIMEQRINQTAEALATQFIAKQTRSQTNSSSNCSSDDQENRSNTPSVTKDQAFLVYKFLNTSQDMLVAGMAQMQP